MEHSVALRPQEVQRGFRDLPRVRLPAPELEPAVVESEGPVRFPAGPFVCGPHLRAVEHETYAICLDCERHVGVHTGRGRFNDHALKGRPCKPLLKKKRAKLVPGFATQLDGFESVADNR
eukprot:5275171-Amphidinium_carterae.1